MSSEEEDLFGENEDEEMVSSSCSRNCIQLTPPNRTGGREE